MSIKVQVDVQSGPETTQFIRLVRWEDAACRARVSVRAMRIDHTADGQREVCEGEADVSLMELARAVDALMARPR